jgi:hypothetical protein
MLHCRRLGRVYARLVARPAKRKGSGQRKHAGTASGEDPYVTGAASSRGALEKPGTTSV